MTKAGKTWWRVVPPGGGIPWRVGLGNLVRTWMRHDIDNLAGSVTFFAVLGLFPFVIFLFSLASLVVDSQQTEELIRHLGRLAPAQVKEILVDRVREIAQQPSLKMLALGGLGAATSATGAVVALITALNAVSGVTEHRPFWKVRGIAFLTMLLGIFAAVVAVAVGVAVPSLAGLLGLEASPWLGRILLALGACAMVVVYSVLYHVLIDVEERLRIVTPGSITGVVLWLAATWGLSFYVSRFPTFQLTYGALGGVIVLLLWMWVSSMTLLLGAALNTVLATGAGPRAGRSGGPEWARAPRP